MLVSRTARRASRLAAWIALTLAAVAAAGVVIAWLSRDMSELPPVPPPIAAPVDATGQRGLPCVKRSIPDGRSQQTNTSSALSGGLVASPIAAPQNSW